MKKGMLKSGFAVIGTMILVLCVVPLLSAWALSAPTPFTLQGTVVSTSGTFAVIHADDGLDITLRFSYGGEMLYDGEHGILTYAVTYKKDGLYDLLNVRDFDPTKRPKDKTLTCPPNSWCQVAIYMVRGSGVTTGARSH